ncbi:hypothetical protein C5Q97_04700 [Victivallales bacterium CCUG 44730]|nr:hypothetical protein C5Q97_04700 [Victivallales bacterium CCUG 44730]
MLTLFRKNILLQGKIGSMAYSKYRIDIVMLQTSLAIVIHNPLEFFVLVLLSVYIFINMYLPFLIKVNNKWRLSFYS